MPEKPLTIAAYAAGVSLAAITLVYVFGPTYFLDGDPSNSSSNAHRTGVVGLYNPANDCFINSVLQSLAGLGDLRIYLIRETHRRSLDGPDIYQGNGFHPTHQRIDDGGKLEGLQKGIVTFALKEVLDHLNERPLQRKTVSAAAFVGALERAFRQRINRQQQDAQEFLQLVAERLSEEYHAGQKAREKARLEAPKVEEGNEDPTLLPQRKKGEMVIGEPIERVELENREDGFPFEGALESQIECLHCRFRPRSSISNFVTLTLHVPQQSSTTLNDCFDGLLKTEYIEDFKCDKCRLEHAVELRGQQLAKAGLTKDRARLENDIARIKEAIRVDPEKPPQGVALPDIKYAPKRRIAKHVRFRTFPRIIAIHLSRSIFDPRNASMKNSAKVTFPERLPLGGLLDRRQYKLLGLVTHKGSHNSGHYESFRRQTQYLPFSTPNVVQPSGAYGSPLSPSTSTAPSPRIGVDESGPGESPDSSPDHQSRPISSSKLPPPAIESPSLPSASLRLASPVSTPVAGPSSLSPPPTSMPKRSSIDQISLFSASSISRFSRDSSRNSLGVPSQTTTTARPSTSTSWSAKVSTDLSRFGSSASLGSSKRKKNKAAHVNKSNEHRWWRISDDRVKESKTSEVLGMQREVYLLFYEMEKDQQT